MPPEKEKTALVLAGGGIMGAAYEIGCLTALDRLFAAGFNSRRFDIYVGVSAGSVIATLVANRIAPSMLFRAIANNEQSAFNFGRRDIYQLDYREMLSSCRQMVTNLYRIFRNYRRNRWRFSSGDIFHILQEQFPSGIFSLGPMQEYLCRSFRREGVIDDFDRIEPELYIPAYDLDRGQRAVFGAEGYRDMHICQAITASCAIPYFFRPYKIDGHFYLDGSIGRLTHIDVAIDRGAKLIVVINPRVPMDNNLDRSCLPSLSYGECSSIADLGIAYTWEQSRRIENKEKLDLALEIYRRKHPDVDIVIIEPGREESLLFFQSPMSSVARHHIMDYGYHLTLGDLKNRYQELQDTFSRHGIRITPNRLAKAPPAKVKGTSVREG